MMKQIIFLLLMGVSLMVSAATKVAIFAGGCFWCVQSDFDKLPGVVKTVVGYDGGTQPDPTYEKVSSGATNYVESLKLWYNPDKVSYQQLLNYFWTHVDPTVKDRQFCDYGRQYRTVIFYLNDEQKRLAEASKVQVEKLLGRVYTDIIPSTHFYDAENYHQDYYKKNPVRYKYYRWNCGRDKRVKQLWQGKSLP